MSAACTGQGRVDSTAGGGWPNGGRGGLANRFAPTPPAGNRAFRADATYSIPNALKALSATGDGSGTYPRDAAIDWPLSRHHRKNVRSAVC